MELDTAQVYSLDDLDRWSADVTSLAVLGDPVAHSLSPIMHAAALAELSKAHPAFATWRYFKFHIEAPLLATALPQFHARGFRGLNLTIPHKEIVLPLLHSVDASVQLYGAANTLVWTEGGYTGANTDPDGLCDALRLEFDLETIDRPVMLLGAGGAARAIALHLAPQVELWIGNRSLQRLEALQQTFARKDYSARFFSLAELPEGLPEAPVIINATALGLKAEDPSPIDLEKFSAETLVYDTTYGPLSNGLRQAAEARGVCYADGLAMLAGQGARSLAAWTGQSVDVRMMLNTVRQALTARQQP